MTVHQAMALAADIEQFLVERGYTEESFDSLTGSHNDDDDGSGRGNDDNSHTQAPSTGQGHELGLSAHMNGRSFTAGFPVWRGPYHANPTASATVDGNGSTGSELDSEYEMETTESENEDGTYEDDARAERHIRVRLDEMELPEWQNVVCKRGAWRATINRISIAPQ